MLQGGRQAQNINLHALLCFCLRMRCVGSTRDLAAATVLRWRLGLFLLCLCEVDELAALMPDDGHGVPCWNKRETRLHKTDELA